MWGTIPTKRRHQSGIATDGPSQRHSGVCEPLLGHHMPVKADGFTGDSAPRPLDDFCASRSPQVAGANGSGSRSLRRSAISMTSGRRQRGQQHVVAEEKVASTRRMALPSMSPLSELDIRISLRRARCGPAREFIRLAPAFGHALSSGQRQEAGLRAARPNPPKYAGRRAMSRAGQATSSAGERTLGDDAWNLRGLDTEEDPFATDFTVLYLLLPVNDQPNTHDVRDFGNYYKNNVEPRGVLEPLACPGAKQMDVPRVLRWQKITAPFIEAVDVCCRAIAFKCKYTLGLGVAILVREALCRTGELHYQEVVPGRLLHVRVGQEHHSLDILGIYQHALHLEAGNNNLPQRLKVWEKLGALLHNLSRRNMLILLGDYNCTPEYVTGAMGHSYDKAGNYPDANEFAALLESHNLILLNGWVRRSQQFTFTGSKHKSIIDFVITRRHHADGQVGLALPVGIPRRAANMINCSLTMRLGMVVLALQHYAQQCKSHTFPWRSEAPEPRAWNTPQVRGSVTAMWQVRIHGPNGEMLRDSAEHEAIVSYFEDLFQSQTAPLPISPGLDAAPQVSEQEVYDSLRSTKYGKAVPPSTPSSAIKCCADLLAQAITPAVNECLQGRLDYRTAALRHTHGYSSVRQGCTLAPLLYVVFSAYLISKLQARLPADWVRDHLTLYADDSHASFEIHSTKDLLQSLQIIACIFDVYREHGMRVNPLKSGVVLGVRGLQATELLKKHLHGTGDKLCLVIGIGKGELRIPVKTSMQYLGICVSYDNFEQETLTARLKVAQATRSRLSKVLSARRYLTQQQRIHLYVLCVRSATLYGLGAVGMTSACLRKLQIFEVKHIRAIVRSPVHLTRETTAHLYKRLRLRLPAQQLHDMLRNRARHVRADASHKQWISQRCGWLGESLQMQKAGLEQITVVQEDHSVNNMPICRLLCSSLRDLLLRNKGPGTVRTPRPKASPCERVSSGPVEPVVRGPYIVLGIAVVSFISSAYFGTRIFRIFNSSLLWKPGPALKMEGSGEAALTEVRSMFPHLAPPLTTAADQEMAPAPLLGRRDRQEEAGETPEKFPRPAGKGQNPLPGKASTAEAPTPNNAPPPAATAAPSTPPKGKEEGRTNRGRTRQWTQEEWDSWTNWSTNNKELSNKELQREVEYLKENVRLLARISMRHEDELSQKRTETDFILTLEVAPPNATPEQEGLLEQLYKMTVEWKKLQEQGKVNNSLRLTLFIGLLMYYELKVQEATASADTVERLAQLGYIRQLDGNPVWNYLRWNYDKEELEPSDQPPLSDTELRSLLTVLKTSIGAPGVLIRFHSSRKLVEQHKTAVTVFLGIGMRDPQALICYRALQQLSYNASTQLVKMRLKPVRMERQPLVKVLQEKFPAPPTRTEEQRVTFLAKAQQQWRKGKGRGRGGQQETQKPSDQPVLRLALYNPHQLCYANSTLLTFLWMGMVQMACPGFDSTMLFGELKPQSLLQAWQPALDRQQAPAILYLQIKRYTQKDGTIHKNMHFFDYQVGTEVRLPVFSSAAGLAVQWRSFSVLSVVVHAGLSVHSGHYQALLSGYQKRPSARRWISLITDDGRTARECTEAQLQHAYCNCYLIGLCMLV
ncbi:unnamed protein product [Symbiodinium sp. KB8]|nr:unnamed protein product [Symbiodinium sp. KB8]